MKREWKTDWNLKQLDEAVDALKAQIASLEKMVSERIGEVMPFESYPGVDFRLEDRGAREKLAEWFNRCKQVRELNRAAIANNTRVREEATSYLKSLGLPASESVSVGTRSRQKYVSQDAGWVQSLRKYIPATDIWPDIEQRHNNHLRKLNEVEQRAKEEEAKKEQQAAREERERAARHVAALIVVKYGLPEESEGSEVLDGLLAKNKYLRLAHFLLKNRGDWSDGYSYAEDGLHGFVVETDEDREIAGEIQGYIDEWDGDGRVFRDCTYSYDWLFAKVEKETPELVADYRKLADAVEVLGG